MLIFTQSHQWIPAIPVALLVGGAQPGITHSPAVRCHTFSATSRNRTAQCRPVYAVSLSNQTIHPTEHKYPIIAVSHVCH